LAKKNSMNPFETSENTRKKRTRNPFDTYASQEAFISDSVYSAIRF
jgi:hypothetical protein